MKSGSTPNHKRFQKEVKRDTPSRYMTDHAGPRRCKCHPGTNFWHPPIEVTQFWHPFFVRPKKIILIMRRGKSMKQKLLEIVQFTVLFLTDKFIFVWSFKNGNGRLNRILGAKTGLLRRAGSITLFPGDTR